MGASEIIGLLGGIALFLFGMAIMGDGLKKVAGSKLELVLYKLTSTPLKGVLLGTGVTAVIQSSSATSVMVVGFVNSGMMKVNQAIGIVMGAILGTSVTGWILCLSSLSGGSGWVTLLSTATLTGLVAVVGIVLRMAAKRPSTHHIGDILLGFAVLMYGMSTMSDAVSPLRDSQVFIDALTSFSNPLLGILAGLLFTSVIQSASAAVGILQALAVTGAITFEIALPIIMGIAIGAAVPVLLSALGANVSGKRTAFVYLLIDVLGVVIWATVFYIANAIAHFDFMTMTMTTVSIALMNTLFRLATVIVLAPLIGLLEKCVCLLIPENPESIREEQEMDRLEERLQARGVRKAEPFHRASAALRELLQDLDAEVSVPAETLQRLFGDIKGFSYSTIGSYSPAFLFFYPMLSRRQDFETLMQQMERLTPDETARNMMISLSLEEQSGPAAGAAAKLVSRVLALTIPTESRLALLEIHQNYRTLLPEIAACLRPAIAALETESGRIQEIIEAFCREVEGLGTESYLRETSSLAITPEVHYHLIPFLMGPDTNLSMEQEDGSVLICCGVMRLSLRRTLAENSSASQVYDAIRIIGDKTRFDILCYLRDHPAVYGQQLCNHFGLARNTIHHHMSKLVNAGLVTCLVEGNRIYYTTDREHLSYLLNQQRQLLIGGEDAEQQEK